MSCMYCNETIEMSDKASGNWYPYNMDRTSHDCRNQAQGTKKVETKTLSLEELDARLKRVESIVIGPRK
jgi:histone acetyltransferase (RNA polymerase elongator complex component)